MKPGPITNAGSEAVLTLLVMIFVGPVVSTAGERAQRDSPDRVEFGIAARYANDAGIETAAAVQFTEDFEHATINDLTAGWESVSHPERMSFSTDTPAGSDGSQSVFFDGSADLYTRVLPGHDHLYVRYYAKLDVGCTNVHHWPWLGGHNPSLVIRVAVMKSRPRLRRRVNQTRCVCDGLAVGRSDLHGSGVADCGLHRCMGAAGRNPCRLSPCDLRAGQRT